MRPKTISASSLANAQACMLKFQAMNIDYTPSFEVGHRNRPADVGKAVHRCLQNFVQLVCIDKTHEWDIELLRELYEEAYEYEFETADRRHPGYLDGLELAEVWFYRTDLSDVQVLSVEQKRRTPIPSAAYDVNRPAHQQPNANAAKIPLSYIWDRCDLYTDRVTGEKTIRIVDYKTIQKLPNVAELKEQIQLRIYALCAFVYFKDMKPDKIICGLDLLRGKGFIGVSFTPQEIVEIWKDLRKELQRILDTTRPRPRVGPGCRYCAITSTCRELRKNVNGGGLMSLSFEEQVRLRAEVDVQTKANGNLMGQLDALIAEEAEQRDELEFAVGDWGVLIEMGSRRTLDHEKLKITLGAELYTLYAPWTMKTLDRLMKAKPDESGFINDGLTDDQRAKLGDCFTTEYNNPSISVSARNE